jgi:glycosyltransferase involved in cell wall biosynthesis
MRRVAVVYKSLPQWRAAFFDRLRERLNEDGVSLELYYGAPMVDAASKMDTSELEWATAVRNRNLSLGKRRLIWQPCMRLVEGADLVVVEQASKLLLNYALLGWQRLSGPKVAFWGHGRNFQDHNSSLLGERIKRRVSRAPHWWFAYTDGSAAVVEALGFPPHRISVVQNSIDVEGLKRARSERVVDDAVQFRQETGVCSEQVAIFSGSLYDEKRIDYLIEATHHIRRLVPTFELIVIGAGPLTRFVETAARENHWIHYFGPQFGVDRAKYFELAKVSLLPGLVGLGIVDSFAMEVPLITVDLPFHSPEIEYLKPNENGLLLPREFSAQQYGEAVAAALMDEALMSKLRDGCRIAAEIYTLHAMVDRFAAGVTHALETR